MSSIESKLSAASLAREVCQKAARDIFGLEDSAAAPAATPLSPMLKAGVCRVFGALLPTAVRRRGAARQPKTCKKSSLLKIISDYRKHRSIGGLTPGDSLELFSSSIS